VSPGYLDRPALTAERFLPDPSRSGGLLYRTGDRGRLRDDGTLDFLGRVDHQVKLRGYRIELEEIESVLAAHPAVGEAAVAIHDERIVAYLTTEDANPASPEALGEHLAAALPDYMVPSRFVGLEAMPRLPNGKIDRRALPPPEGPRSDPDRPLSPPRTAVERIMAGIWAETLELDEVGIDEDFFELGGHSLLAAQLFARLRDVLRLDAPLRSLFDNRTIEALARELTRDPAEGKRLERTAELTLQVLGLGQE
jgi:hypothetical protein